MSSVALLGILAAAGAMVLVALAWSLLRKARPTTIAIVVVATPALAAAVPAVLLADNLLALADVLARLAPVGVALRGVCALIRRLERGR